MIETAVIGLRWVQYLAATAALGLTAFGAQALDDRLRRAVVPYSMSAGGLLVASALGGVLAQTAMMAGSWTAGLDPVALGYVVQSTGPGGAHILRAGLALAGVLVLLIGHGTRRATAGAILAFAAAMASFAWSGHGAATEGGPGLVHLAADLAHLLAAAVWLGALFGFCLLLTRPRPGDIAATSRALVGFANLGTGAVAVLVATGAVNAGFLVGVNGLSRITGSTWGVLLLVKLALFALMLGLAAHNRFRLAPALSRAVNDGVGTGSPIRRLRTSVGLETLAGVALLAAVAAMGVQIPPAAL